MNKTEKLKTLKSLKKIVKGTLKNTPDHQVFLCLQLRELSDSYREKEDEVMEELGLSELYRNHPLSCKPYWCGGSAWLFNLPE